MDTGAAPWVRWLAVPAVLVMLSLAALAITSEGRDEFVSRSEAEAAAESNDSGQSSSGESGSGQSSSGGSSSGSGGSGSGGSGAAQGSPYPADRLIIQTPDGPIELSLNGQEVQGRTDGTGETGSGNFLALRPDPNGNIIGFRIDENGNFVPVERGESTEGLTLLVPQEDGSLLLIRPDGTEIELYYTDNGLEARVDDGEGYALQAEDGSVRVDDLVMTPLPPGQRGNLDDFQQLPPDGLPQLEDGEPGTGNQITPEDFESAADENSAAENSADDNSADDGGSLPWRTILIIALVAIGIGLAVWWFIAFRPRREEELVPAPVYDVAPAGLSAWEAFEAFLAELAADPDPTRAIRLAFAYAEQGMGRLPGRQEDETPHEWLARAANNDDPVASALQPLVERYTDIRFGRHVASSDERDAALVELRSLVELSMQHREPLGAR